MLLRTFVGGARDPTALERSDEELVSLTLDALTPLLGITGAPLLTRVYRWERANAQHEVGHLARMAAIERGARRDIRDCSSPAAAFAASAFPTASPTAARRRDRLPHGCDRRDGSGPRSVQEC